MAMCDAPRRGTTCREVLGDVSLHATVPGVHACAWCRVGIPETKRRDAIYCSKRCRQAAHRFYRGAPRRLQGERSLVFAYADPPYPGMAHRYRGHVDYAGEVDHASLVDGMTADYSDGWALSTSAAALPEVLSVSPAGVRVAAWFRGERPTRSYRPLSGWEPVVVFGGRPYLSSPAERRVDALVHVARARTTDPVRVLGTKPAAFAYWLFDLLGALPGDTLDDLFPGSGGIARAWRAYTDGPPVAEDVTTRVVVRSKLDTSLKVSAGSDDVTT